MTIGIDVFLWHGAGVFAAGLVGWLVVRASRHDAVTQDRTLTALLVFTLAMLPALAMVRAGWIEVPAVSWAANVTPPTSPRGPDFTFPTGGAEATPEPAGETATPVAPESVEPTATTAPSVPFDSTPWFAALLALGAAVFSVNPIRRWRRQRALLAVAVPVTDRQVRALWRSLLTVRYHDRREPRLLQVEDLPSPACCGILRPAVLVPTDAAGSSSNESLAFGLRHELAHLRRRDPLRVALQTSLRVLCWYHPVTWWLSHRLDAVRESAVDARIVAETGRARSYAHALLDFAVPGSAFTLHCSGTRIEERIEMMSQSRTIGGPARVLRGAALFLLLAAVTAAQVVTLATRTGAGPDGKKGMDEGKPLELTIFAAGHEGLEKGRPPIHYKGKQPKDIRELRKWLRTDADLEHPCTTYPDGKPFPSIGTHDGKKLYPSNKRLLIRCAGDQVFGWVQVVLQVCTFVPGRSQAKELAESPLIWKTEFLVDGSKTPIVTHLPTDKGIRFDHVKTVEVEILLKVPKDAWETPVAKRTVILLRRGDSTPFGRIDATKIKDGKATFTQSPPSTLDAMRLWMKQQRERSPDATAKVNAYSRAPAALAFEVVKGFIDAGYTDISYSGILRTLMRELENGRIR
ncbi:MAG: hypothetical protein CMJ83_18500 [Planctomycetes bacterium]|nr:hypothetical protein [Planctomycetota bacterium]